MDTQLQKVLTFENVWKKEDPDIQQQAMSIWKRYSSLTPEKIEGRKRELLFVVKDQDEVVGISTAFKTYIKQLRNHLYVYRCLIVPHYSIPGLDAKLTVLSRDFLESIHQNDCPDPAIGMLALIHHPKLKERNLGHWPASGLVYIGSSKEGKHIRVYYFKGARIIP
jgi:hypothetical protein